MITLATLALIWVLAFAIFFVPARMIGTWLVRKSSPGAGFVFLNVCICFMIAKLIVVIGVVVLVFGRFEVFPHVNDDPEHFGLFFVAVLLFVPTFAALITGYMRARRIAAAALRPSC